MSFQRLSDHIVESQHRARRTLAKELFTDYEHYQNVDKQAVMNMLKWYYHAIIKVCARYKSYRRSFVLPQDFVQACLAADIDLFLTVRDEGGDPAQILNLVILPLFDHLMKGIHKHESYTYNADVLDFNITAMLEAISETDQTLGIEHLNSLHCRIAEQQDAYSPDPENTDIFAIQAVLPVILHTCQYLSTFRPESAEGSPMDTDSSGSVRTAGGEDQSQYPERLALSTTATLRSSDTHTIESGTIYAQSVAPSDLTLDIRQESPSEDLYFGTPRPEDYDAQSDGASTPRGKPLEDSKFEFTLDDLRKAGFNPSAIKDGYNDDGTSVYAPTEWPNTEDGADLDALWPNADFDLAALSIEGAAFDEDFDFTINDAPAPGTPKAGPVAQKEETEEDLFALFINSDKVDEGE